MTHTYPYMDVQITWPPTISYPPSASYIYGQTIILYCGGRDPSGDLITGDWSLNGKSLNYHDHTYTAVATFEAEGDYECTGNPGITLNVRVLGEFPPPFPHLHTMLHPPHIPYTHIRTPPKGLYPSEAQSTLKPFSSMCYHSRSWNNFT